MADDVRPDALWTEVARYGEVAHLITVAADGAPHVVSVRVRADGERLALSAGRTSRENLTANPSATVLWAAAPGGEYSLLVDGRAVVGSGDGDLLLQPTSAVLHRVADAPGDGPSCVRLIAKP